MADLEMHPQPGARFVRHAGDFFSFALSNVPAGFTAKLRTNLGRGERLREEIIHAHFGRLPLAGASWRDIPMRAEAAGRWSLAVPLTEVGFFKAKAYSIDPSGRQHWPPGPDVALSVHPSWTRTANTIYCAFPRMFGANKTKRVSVSAELEARLATLDAEGYAVIPPGGKLRDLTRELPHILRKLKCRILHLLPINPTPTTFARFGRFGSPYALQHLTAIDPALIEFDRHTTGLDQFAELTYEVHRLGGRLILDVVINHTGWGSALWEDHPEWFVRKPDGQFESPGAWDVVWEDLVELDQRHVPLWEHVASAFLTWCRRGVDGFRCDAGYKIPVHVWQFITARVREEFPETVFLLEGLGGSWEATRALLGEGGMQWAYSELFQNFTGESVGRYLDHMLSTSAEVGTLVHYSETHDNSRLAASPVPGALPAAPPIPNLAWSRLRNRLCALTSVNGGFGFACGVEWGATEQINVHSARGLAWGDKPNLVDELAALNSLLSEHPCFFDGARLTRLSPDGSPVYALRRDSAEGKDSLLILINTDATRHQSVKLANLLWGEFCGPSIDLLRTTKARAQPLDATVGQGSVEVTLQPGAAHCFALSPQPRGLHGDDYRNARARADWAFAAAGRARGLDVLECPPSWELWLEVAARVAADPATVLAQTLGTVEGGYQPVIHWRRSDRTRITLVPADHWLLLHDSVAFRAQLHGAGSAPIEAAYSVPVAGGFVACFPPRRPASPREGNLQLERYDGDERSVRAPVRFLSPTPELPPNQWKPDSVVLLTNGRGAMGRMRIDLGSVRSKYDCVLGANLHPQVPVDRHVWIKRVRAWINADGFVTNLNFDNLISFEPGPPAHWRFLANAGDGRSVEVHLVADFLEQQNTVVLQFVRPERDPTESRIGRPLEASARVTLSVRLDLEDRSFHSQTKYNDGANHHFTSNCRPAVLGIVPSPSEASSFNGFEFTPAGDRKLRVWTTRGEYHHATEWSLNISHPVEASRGQEGAGDAFSPGWFEIPLPTEGSVAIVASAEAQVPNQSEISGFAAARGFDLSRALGRAGAPFTDDLTRRLVRSIQAYVVRRNETRSVIAGYPWFLDWGRDSLIAARGLIAAGLCDEVRELLITFGRFEQNGTLPNSIHGNDASNRDTSDAPLWFGIVCEELAAALPPNPAGPSDLYETCVDAQRNLTDVLRSIACGYLQGTMNGIIVDAESSLVWSPAHFTWMDTNYPAGTPREGFPIEIQALWIRLLRQLANLGAEPPHAGVHWQDLAQRAEESFHRYFWLEGKGWYADVLQASRGQSAMTAQPSDALRNNCLFAVSLGIDRHPEFRSRARRMLTAAAQHLVVPGALRSLAPLAVTPPLPIQANHGGLLNDPVYPYWPRYEGDEDSRRKPSYHNGTAWTWTFPSFCEGLVKAYPGDPQAQAAARSYLSSVDQLLLAGCLGHLPEITDGDAPHTPRGCDAQAWSVTEVLRVWRALQSNEMRRSAPIR